MATPTGTTDGSASALASDFQAFFVDEKKVDENNSESGSASDPSAIDISSESGESEMEDSNEESDSNSKNDEKVVERDSVKQSHDGLGCSSAEIKKVIRYLEKSNERISEALARRKEELIKLESENSYLAEMLKRAEAPGSDGQPGDLDPDAAEKGGWGSSEGSPTYVRKYSINQ